LITPQEIEYVKHRPMIPRLVIAGVSSGVGKTTIAVGLAAAFRARGLSVRTFKCGPDYLDPTYHARATGRSSPNLDGWMMGKDAVMSTFARASKDADLAIVEGMMGLFDGASPNDDAGSTAEIAKWLCAPVLLVVDASGLARSIAAIAAGFCAFDPELSVMGIAANRIGGRAHLDLLRDARPSPPILGGLTAEAALAFPERHLGLRAADRATVPDALFSVLADRVEASFDLDAILAIAKRAPRGPEDAPAPRPPPRRSCRIGVAYDEAFHFYYPDNLDRLEDHGAELVRFSPIADPVLPDIDGLLLGGGYPELFAEALSRNASMQRAIAELAARGRPIYAECGGLMYLAEAIRTIDGVRHPMVGLVRGEAVMAPHLMALGYVEIETKVDSVLGPRGLSFRGHQFRWSTLEGEGAVANAFEDGYQPMKNVLASYVHAHWASNARIPAAFVAACSAR
jgi:cobyrinic acid a,c-diamide synthase